MADLQTTIAQVVGSQITLALRNHRAEMKTGFQEIQSSVNALSNKVDDISDKFTSIENRMDMVEDRIDGMKNVIHNISDDTSSDINLNKVTDICMAELFERETRKKNVIFLIFQRAALIMLHLKHLKIQALTK